MATKAKLKVCKWKGGDEAKPKPGRRRRRVQYCVVKRTRGKTTTVSCHVSAQRAKSVARKKKGRVVKRKT